MCIGIYISFPLFFACCSLNPFRAVFDYSPNLEAPVGATFNYRTKLYMNFILRLVFSLYILLINIFASCLLAQSCEQTTPNLQRALGYYVLGEDNSKGFLNYF